MTHTIATGPDITLRDVTADDRPLLFAIYASTRTEELARVPWTAEMKEQFLRQQFDAQDRWYREQYEGTEFHVVLVDGIAVGRLYLARSSDALRVLDIALFAPHRGRGLGTRLLQQVMRDAAATNRQVLLHVEIFNRARRLYERLGFRPLGEPTGVHQCMEWRPSIAMPAPS